MQYACLCSSIPNLNTATQSAVKICYGPVKGLSTPKEIIALVSRPSTGAAIGAETVAVLFLIGAALIIKILCAFHYRIDSDESQHLHVVWSWTQGMLPYRDVFDNHSPIFHALCAPLFQRLGERADILIPMRLAMIPLFSVSLWLVWKLGASVFWPRAGPWAAAFTACYPPFFLTSTEFRPDNLWTVVWLATIWIIINGQPKPARAFFAGLLLGISFCISMKTLLMAITIVCALAMIWVLRCSFSERVALQKVIACAFFGLIGIIPAPCITAWFFMLHGAGTEMYYGVIAHNVLPGSVNFVKITVGLLKWLALMTVPVCASFLILKRVKPKDQPVTTRQLLVLFVAICYFATLKSFWQFLTAEDFLPFYPLLMAVLSAALLAGIDFLKTRTGLSLQGLPGFLSLGGLVSVFFMGSPLQNQTQEKTGIVGNALRLTTPADYVMDSKGETIFRRRASRLVFEEITGLRVKRGLMNDDIRERLIATGAPLTTLLRMPREASQFIERNYIPIAFRLRVLGQIVQAEIGSDGSDFNFEIVIPTCYSILAESGVLAGTLNDDPWLTPHILVPGHYHFHRTSGRGKLALIWTKAFNEGFSPFAEVKPDHRDDQD